MFCLFVCFFFLYLFLFFVRSFICLLVFFFFQNEYVNVKKWEQDETNEEEEEKKIVRFAPTPIYTDYHSLNIYLIFNFFFHNERKMSRSHFTVK